MLARRFLWVIVGLVMLTIAAALGYRLFSRQLMELALVPSAPFAAPAAPTGGMDYRRAALWLSRPNLPDDPARWAPEGYSAAPRPGVAVFYIHPTTYLGRDRWNGPLDDAEANDRARLFAQTQASAFNGIGAIWAPRYRQATFGAFLTARADAQKAIDVAYADVLAAFDNFIASVPSGRPIILAAHSQGSLHLLRLMKERVAGTPLASRIVAAYAVGWPVSVEADLPALGLPACTDAAQPGCVLSWQSFAEPADADLVLAAFNDSQGLAGQPRKGSQMLCVNPLTGLPGDTAAPAANLGALRPSADYRSMTIEAGRIGARCTADGLLSIGAPPPGFGHYVLPGNNYHVYDYALFWANIRADAEARAAAFAARQRS